MGFEIGASIKSRWLKNNFKQVFLSWQMQPKISKCYVGKCTFIFGFLLHLARTKSFSSHPCFHEQELATNSFKCRFHYVNGNALHRSSRSKDQPTTPASTHGHFIKYVQHLYDVCHSYDVCSGKPYKNPHSTSS